MPATVKEWLTQATKILDKAGVSSAKLDSELILSDTMEVGRTWLAAHDGESIPSASLRRANMWLGRRAEREPLAYIRGWVEFYGQRFLVDKRVLIPRPETEEIIELVKSLKLPQKPALIDVGTGSGCIAITAKLEWPELEVHATDISEPALKVARQNAKTLQANVDFHKSDLLSAMDHRLPASIITANLPYVGRRYTVTPEAKAEPDIALYAGGEGYELIERLLPQAAENLASSGYLILESDPWQQARIIKTASKYGFRVETQRPFHLVLTR